MQPVDSEIMHLFVQGDCSEMAETLLITGGAGYIGTHSLVELIDAGMRPVVFDNFSNSVPESLRRVERITGVCVPVVQGDIRDAKALDAVFAHYAQEGHPVSCVVHFAALKAVGESVSQPVRYYDNNVHGTLVLLEAMQRAGVRRIVFSSSATVYGEPVSLPYTEDHRIAPTNPYGSTKAMVEQVLQDLCQADPDFTAVTLRYFNPIGAHPSGLIGEDPQGDPNNLFPYITRVAVGRLAALSVFGDDYPTVDGTGVRDYLHVVDLARGHVKAVEYCASNKGFVAINLGTGRGTSVFELVDAFVATTGRAVPRKVSGRRPGDIASAWADASKAQQLLGWNAEYSIEQMCEDGWRWQSSNPQGYGPAE